MPGSDAAASKIRQRNWRVPLRAEHANQALSRPERFAVGSVAGVFKRRHAIFLAFPFESFLGRSEVCDACRDFFSRTSEPVVLVGHCPSFLSRVPVIGRRDWGVNADAALQDCDCARRPQRWIRSAPCLWLSRRLGSQNKRGELHGKDRSGLTEHRRTRELA
jgi:hypothetical protein